MKKTYKILDTIHSPEDLRRLDKNLLPQLCDEIRKFIIDVISENPGHLGSSLGSVELAVALHYVFNTPDDKLIWDVGHQAYPHKILTGRKDNFHTNRMYKGLSGFPKMSESPYDAFGVGHSSTSISAALGMAVASALKGERERCHIAVIGDGSMTGGMAFEALNHAGAANANVLVILNDNGIAIDKSVGALSNYLTKITASRRYNQVKNKIWHIVSGRKSRQFIANIANSLKSMVLKQSNLFESLGFRYFGPINGNDLEKLTKVLKNLKEVEGPKLLHIITVKGKGLNQAEKEPTLYHAPGEFNSQTGELIRRDNGVKTPPRYQDVFGKTLVELAEKNPKIVGITPAMPTGCSLNLMMECMPDRAFDVGIAEQHAVTFAAGLAAQGMVPFCNIYSSFSQRAYDQVIHDVALQKLQVVFCFDRAGLVGEDGATHHGSFDLACFRPIPNLTIVAPMNEVELRNMMYTAQLPQAGAWIIRYPRGKGVLLDWEKPFHEIERGKGIQVRQGVDLAIITIGSIGNHAIQACEILDTLGVQAAHYNMRFLKPLDETLLHEVFKMHKKIITIEDGVITGGLGSSVLEFMNQYSYQSKVVRLGIPDYFVEHGSVAELQKECGFDVDSIVKIAMEGF